MRRSGPIAPRRRGGHGDRQQDGTQRPTTGAHTITRAAIIVFICFFYEAVLLLYLSIHVTGLRSVGRVVYPSWEIIPSNDRGPGIIAVLLVFRQPGKTRRSFMFVWWVLVRFLFFRCLSASLDSTPDLRACVSPCSRLPCVSYGAGSTPDSKCCSQYP